MKISRPQCCGARVNLPRDLHACYVIGRMGAVTSGDLWPLFWGAPASARHGFARLERLGLIRGFARRDPSHPKWFSLTESGADFVTDNTDGDEKCLRLVAGLGRMNLAAVSARNRLWVSLVLAMRACPSLRIAVFRPEWELRAAKKRDRAIVPDAVVAIDRSTGGHRQAWMMEIDSGSERSAVWRHKAEGYAEARKHAALFGERRWNLLAVVPTERRAVTVAVAVADAGAGSFTWLGLSHELGLGHAFDSVLWLARDLAHGGAASVRRSLLDGMRGVVANPDQRPRSAVDRGVSRERAAYPR